MELRATGSDGDTLVSYVLRVSQGPLSRAEFSVFLFTEFSSEVSNVSMPYKDYLKGTYL